MATTEDNAEKGAKAADLMREALIRKQLGEGGRDALLDEAWELITNCDDPLRGALEGLLEQVGQVVR